MATTKVNKTAALLLALVMVFCMIPPSFAAAPTAPANLTATAGNGSVILSWTAVSGAVSYNVYMGTATGTYDTNPVAEGVTGHIYRVTSLTNDITYFFAVTAVNTDGVSAYSNEASAKPTSGAAYASPTIITSSVNKSGTGLVSLSLSNATPDWVSNVTGVTVDGTPLTTGQYSATTSAIQIDSTAFHKNARDTYNLVVSAAGYSNMSAAVAVKNLGAKTLQIRIVGKDGVIYPKKTFNMTDMQRMEQPGDAYYNSICSMVGLRTFEGRGVLLTDLLNSAGVRFRPGMSLQLRTNDMATTGNDSSTENAYYSRGLFTYENLLGTTRYYFPNIYTDGNLKSTLLAAGKFDDTVKTSLAASTKIPVRPMLALQYIEKIYRSDQTPPDGNYSPLVFDEMSFRFLYGIALNATNSARIADETTTWSVAYDTFGIDIIDPDYIGDITPPALTADTTGNVIGQPVDLTFTDDLEWRDAVTGVTVNGTPVTGYTLNTGTLTIPASAFTAAGSYAVTVSAAGYTDDTMTQNMGMGPQITGYTISPNHGGTVFYPTGSTIGTDDQYETVVVQFDKPISILNAGNVINDDLDIELNGSGQITTTNATDISTPGSAGYKPYATVAAGGDGKSLVLTIHIGFAMYAGHLTVNASSNGIHNIVAADGTTPVNWTNIACYIPNGVQLKTLSQAVGNTATVTPASVTIQAVTPSSSLRCMVHVLLLKNGVTVAPDANGASVECHYHDYLGMDGTANGPATYAALVKGFFTSSMYPAIAPNYTTVCNGDQVTVTENSPVDGDVLDLLVYAYPQDRPTGADKTALDAAITAGTPYAALKNEIAIASAVDTCVYYQQSAVDDEVQTLNAKIAQVAPPATPANLTATAGSGKVTLSWASVTGATGYNVYMGTSTGTYSTTPAATGVTANTYTVTNLTNGTPYFFVVTAVNTNGESARSTETSATPVSSGGSNSGGGSTPSQPVASTTGSAAVTPSAGGTISLVNSASTPLAAVNIPAGALQGNTNANVAITSVASPPSPPAGDTIVGAYDFTVNGGGCAFNSNVTLTFTFDPAKIPAGTTPVVEYYDNTAKQWVVVKGTVANSTITVTVNHFTTFAVIAVPNASSAPLSAAFSDVSSSFWGYDAISSLNGKGVVGGYPDGTFKPDTSITRAEFATMLVKALGLNTSGTTGMFADVTAGSWYYGAVNAAAAAGLVSGTGDHLFAPGGLITREQMAVMVAKALGTKAITVDGTELNAFSDKPAVSSWAASGMEEAVKAGIVSGMTADTLAPMENSTRAQAAAMIYKVLGILGK